MAMFLLTYTDEARTSDVEARLAEKDILFRKVAPCSFALVSKTLVTPREMYEHLDAEGGEFGNMVVVRFDAYWGFHNADFWNWLQGHGESL